MVRCLVYYPTADMAVDVRRPHESLAAYLGQHFASRSKSDSIWLRGQSYLQGVSTGMGTSKHIIGKKK
jgi:hypothetical protein